MSFCSKCGAQLVGGARFCAGCGTPVGSSGSGPKSTYSGIIHKCPQCGEALNSFETNCSACGWEIRGTQTISSVKELAVSLSKIDAELLPLQPTDEKTSLLKMIFGKDFRKPNAEMEKQRKLNFEKQKMERKANLIRMFPVPNAKEDILEFLQCAVSQMSENKKAKDELSKAWQMKFKQCDQKAKIMLSGDNDYEAFQKFNYKLYSKLKIKTTVKTGWRAWF